MKKKKKKKIAYKYLLSFTSRFGCDNEEGLFGDVVVGLFGDVVVRLFGDVVENLLGEAVMCLLGEFKLLCDGVLILLWLCDVCEVPCCKLLAVFGVPDAVKD